VIRRCANWLTLALICCRITARVNVKNQVRERIVDKIIAIWPTLEDFLWSNLIHKSNQSPAVTDSRYLISMTSQPLSRGSNGLYMNLFEFQAATWMYSKFNVYDYWVILTSAIRANTCCNSFIYVHVLICIDGTKFCMYDVRPYQYLQILKRTHTATHQCMYHCTYMHVLISIGRIKTVFWTYISSYLDTYQGVVPQYVSVSISMCPMLGKYKRVCCYGQYVQIFVCRFCIREQCVLEYVQRQYHDV
jgi:hypothetical protein